MERRFPNPVSRLIEAHDSLGLNDLQLERLRTLEADLRTQNEALVKQLPQAPAGGGSGGRGGGRGGGGRGMGGGMGGGRRGGGEGRGGDPGKAREIMQQIEAQSAAARGGRWLRRLDTASRSAGSSRSNPTSAWSLHPWASSKSAVRIPSF
jgi:hypothetical protein